MKKDTIIEIEKMMANAEMSISPRLMPVGDLGYQSGVFSLRRSRKVISPLSLFISEFDSAETLTV
jgi:hypothetical protein